MSIRKLLNLAFSIMLVSSLLFGGVIQVGAQGQDPPPPPPTQPPPPLQDGVITAAERQAVADANEAAGLTPEIALAPQAVPEMAPPGSVPHYYGPYPNYANSPLPVETFPLVSTPFGNPLIDRAYATDYNAAAPVPVLVTLAGTELPDGTLESFQAWNQSLPGGSPGPSAGNTFNAYVLRPTGNANEYLVAYDSGTFVVPDLADPGVSELATYPVTPGIPVQAGDILAFYGAGIPVDIVATGTDVLSFPSPMAPELDSIIVVGDANFPVYPQARTYSFGAVIGVPSATPTLSGGMRKFVDGLPGLGAANANNLGQYLPVAVPDTTSYPGSDYYVIELVEYTEQMHSDLPPTTLRGYRQANMGGSPPHYLGPAIVATKDRPVRILFRNLLPTGQGGNLFLPVDTTVMGSGMGPNMGGMAETDPQNPMCGNNPKPAGCYSENRATLHLHGGISPWISDGTPHQWITPANENTPYPEGVSVENVPDMPEPGPGEMTFFYTNQQSARLMFYHDHAWGITRLNVYAGEAAAYLITDDTEQALMAPGGALEDVGLGIPLVIQDKTFVPPLEQLAMQDPTWDLSRWGGEGDLWLPHVYVPAQNPGDASGVNQFGRWAYGPWFWPPTTNIDYGPIANPYYDEMCDPDVQWCEPPLIPGVPFNSMGMEAFMDTPVVNGTAYPTIELDAKPYRFRILNAANDRFFNLSLYQAIDANGVLCDAANSNPAAESTGVACSEVALNPAEVAAALSDPAGVFPTPVAGTEGPDWIQIATEGGFLPAPTVIPAQPTTWVTDPTVFNAGNVDQHSLLIGPAERADVVVDFSQYAGQTLILYNDAPAAFPARDPRYDYYTGNPDLTDTGGTPPTLPGYGPNTRTVMQITVKGGAGPSFNLGALQTAFKSQSLGGQGVFENGQHPIIVGQSAYNSAYGSTFPLNGPSAGLVQIFNTSFSFKTLLGDTLTMPLQPKQIQDEMGEAFEREYGRMSGFLGVESPNATAGAQNMILYPYVNPASEVFDGIELPPGMEVTPIATADDGTQIWKITHNGVDTHPIHFHLYDVQLINRVGWDGIIRRPDPNELGWKDTVRVSPLEDTIVAMRPIIPKIPFGVFDSFRPLNPMMPLGSTAMFNSTDIFGNPIVPPITNQIVNFGWEYVWHCHILSHEEMDMMRPVSVNVARTLPDAPVLSLTGDPGNPIALAWTDGTPVSYSNMNLWGDPANEVGFRIERSLGAGPFEPLGSALANTTGFTDNSTVAGTSYQYRVVAFNAAGDSLSNIVAVGTIVVPPTPELYFSTVGNSNPPGVTGGADNADIYNWNGTAFSRMFDATGVGLPGNANVDGLMLIDETHFYLSFNAATTTVPGLGVVEDEDVVEYNNGAWSLYFDGTAQGLTANSQDLDAINIVGNTLYFSTVGNGAVPGAGGPYDDADIYSWDGASFSRVYDASVAGLPGNANVDGLVWNNANDFYLSFSATTTTVPGLGAVEDEKIVQYSSGTWSVYFDGTALGLITNAQDLDAFSIGAAAPPPPPPPPPGAAFPATLILDDFNRGGGNAPLGGNWSGTLSQTQSAYRINTFLGERQVQVRTTNGGGLIYWNQNIFGADQEAYFTFTDLSSIAAEQESGPQTDRGRRCHDRSAL